MNGIIGSLFLLEGKVENTYYQRKNDAVADPRDVDTIEVTYLNGKRTPTLESKVSWDTLGIEWRMYHDFGINVLDYRGVAYNQGK